jgi:integration host factor subunit alpha
MTKADIRAQVYEKLGFSKRESSGVVERFLAIIKRCLAVGTNVKISGLGNFIVRKKKPEREGIRRQAMRSRQHRGPS